MSAYYDKVKQNLTSGGLTCYTDKIINGDVLVCYIKKFRLAWIATQLNTFIILGTKDNISKPDIESFSHSCFEYALKNNRGWPRGVQSGIGSIAVLTGSNVDDQAQAYCLENLKKHWSAFEIPVIHNSNTNELFFFRNNPIWGRIYFPYFRKLIESNLR